MTEHCSVCLPSVERRQDKRFRHKKQVHSSRCGPFEISEIALAMRSISISGVAYLLYMAWR